MISSSSAWLRLMVIAVLTTCVVACGSDPTLSGNDETSTTDPVDDDGDNGDVDVDVGGNFESIRVLVSTPQLPSGASTSDDGVTINAILADANNNAVAGITVTFSADSGVLQVTQPTTDDSGTASATLTTGGDPTNREILVTARAANVSSSVTVYVTGTRLLLSGPASIGSGDEGTYTIQLLDSDSVGIANEIVTVESEAGLVTPEMVTATTNADGQVSLVLTGRTGGDDTLTVSALGLSTSQTVSVSEFNLDIASPAATAEVPLDTPQTITARVTQNGNPAADGQMVQFASTRGTLSSAEAQTSNGTADVTVQASGAGAAGLATISAVTSGGAAEQIQIEFVAVVEFIATV